LNKLLLSVFLCLGLAACTATPVDEETAEGTTIEKSTDAAVDASVEPVEESKSTEQAVEEPIAEVKPVEIQPEPKPQPKPVPPPIETEEGKLILGGLEWVYVPGLDKSLKAKIDSGATTSSISAVDVVPFEREGKEWVKFRVQHGKVSSDEISLPILRWAKIKQANSAVATKRPVVTAWIEVGKVKEKADFTLTDRNHLEYPVILGQSFFRDIAIVDVSREFVQAKKK
jgi:hypothetical protein